MSTLAWGLADALRPRQSEAEARLLEPLHRRRARHRPTAPYLAHLAAMGDARLTELGFSADDISALRTGELASPRPSQRGSTVMVTQHTLQPKRYVDVRSDIRADRRQRRQLCAALWRRLPAPATRIVAA